MKVITVHQHVAHHQDKRVIEWRDKRFTGGYSDAHTFLFQNDRMCSDYDLRGFQKERERESFRWRLCVSLTDWWN